MNFRALEAFCRTLPGTTEDIKWGADRVFSVGGKMYAGFDADGDIGVSFKCSDDDFDRLTRKPGIIPAPYAARFGWVSVQTKDALTQSEAKRLIEASYRLVRDKLPTRLREQIAGAAPEAPSKPRPRRRGRR